MFILFLAIFYFNVELISQIYCVNKTKKHVLIVNRIFFTFYVEIFI